MTYKNFFVLAEGIDVSPIINALNAQPELWNQFPLRTTHPMSPHTEADDIVIRFNKLTDDPYDTIDDYESYWYPAAGCVPVHPFMYHLQGMVMGDRLGRSVITRLAPGTKIESHEDHGSPVSYYQRFHIALQQEPGAKFICGDEVFEPNVGDIFIFDNSKTHSVVNDSPASRITMIIDIRTPIFEHIKQTQMFSAPKSPKNISHERPTYGPGITYQVESFTACISELKLFAPLHWEELGMTKDNVPLDMDWTRYTSLEQENKLHFVSARKDGELIGYHITFVGGHYHYKSTLHGMVDLYFIKKEYRLGRTGIRLFKFAEQALKDIGVTKIITGTKLHSDNSKLFEYLGYHFSDKTYIKIIV